MSQMGPLPLPLFASPQTVGSARKSGPVAGTESAAGMLGVRSRVPTPPRGPGPLLWPLSFLDVCTLAPGMLVFAPDFSDLAAGENPPHLTPAHWLCRLPDSATYLGRGDSFQKANLPRKDV